MKESFQGGDLLADFWQKAEGVFQGREMMSGFFF